MKLIIAFELESTGDAEISLFHKLSTGNGRNPLRPAPCPSDIPLQLGACVTPVTVKLTLCEVLLPGSGFCTLIEYVPALVIFPVAINCVEEFRTVETALPFANTSAPLINLLPLTVTEKFRVFGDVGLIPLITGIGFTRVTALVPASL